MPEGEPRRAGSPRPARWGRPDRRHGGPPGPRRNSRPAPGAKPPPRECPTSTKRCGTAKVSCPALSVACRHAGIQGFLGRDRGKARATALCMLSPPSHMPPSAYGLDVTVVTTTTLLVRSAEIGRGIAAHRTAGQESVLQVDHSAAVRPAWESTSRRGPRCPGRRPASNYSPGPNREARRGTTGGPSTAWISPPIALKTAEPTARTNGESSAPNCPKGERVCGVSRSPSPR